MSKSLYFLILYLCCVAMQLSAGEVPQGIITLDSQPATSFKITDYDSNSYELVSSRGRWVFVHFWASWCGPCRREMPIIQKLRNQLKDRPIDFVLINTAEDEDTIFSFLGGVSPDMHSYMDRDGELTEQWQPRGLPTTFFIDPKGKRRYLALGGRDWLKDEYQQFLQDMFK